MKTSGGDQRAAVHTLSSYRLGGNHVETQQRGHGDLSLLCSLGASRAACL